MEISSAGVARSVRTSAAMLAAVQVVAGFAAKVRRARAVLGVAALASLGGSSVLAAQQLPGDIVMALVAVPGRFQ